MTKSTADPSNWFSADGRVTPLNKLESTHIVNILRGFKRGRTWGNQTHKIYSLEIILKERGIEMT